LEIINMSEFKRTRGVGRPTKSKLHTSDPDISELYADREFEERLVRQSFDAWTNGDFVPEVEVVPDDDVLPCERVLFVTEGGFVRIIDSEGNYETYDPYLPENAWILSELLGESPDSSDEEDE
jgi:hypothetical protein